MSEGNNNLGKILVSLVIVALVVVIGLVGYWQFLAPEPPTPTPVPESLEDVPLTAEGRLVPVKDVSLAFRLGGRVSSVHVAEGGQVEAGQVLVELETADLQANLDQAEAALEAAKAQEAMAPDNTSEDNKKLLAANVAQAQAALDAAQAALAEAQLCAPFAGTIVVADVKVGEIVPPAAPVVVLADLSRWRVETLDLREEDAVLLHEGQRTEIKISALPGQEFEGTVSKIALSASAYQGDVTYAVTIDLEEGPPDARLSWGMVVYLEIDPNQPIPLGPTLTPIPLPSPTHMPTPAASALATDNAPPASLTPIPLPSCGPPPTWVQYTVRRGDTLFSLARRTGTTVETVRQANCLVGNAIYAGQWLWLPFNPRVPSYPTAITWPTLTREPTSTLTPATTDTPTSTPSPANTPTPTEMPTDAPTPSPPPEDTPTSSPSTPTLTPTLPSPTETPTPTE